MSVAEAAVPKLATNSAVAPAMFATPAIQAVAKPVELSRPAPQWTDDYSNLLQVLR
jgi:hypothetical protein